MDELNKNIGARLKEIREVFNEGTKLSATQFGFLMNETRDKITNYENGRTPVSPKLLLELYRRGINPVYILSGEGEIFAGNRAGVEFKQRIINKLGHLEMHSDSTQVYKAAAGTVRSKSKTDDD